MFKKLKRKFVLLATVSMLLLMTVLVLIMNIVNYSSIVSESDRILDLLSQQDFLFLRDGDPVLQSRPDVKMNDLIPRGMSPEVPYESRYFTVQVSADGKITESDFSRIVSVGMDSVNDYIGKALNGKRDRGFIGNFRYSKTTEDQNTRIMFLDCGRKMDAFQTFLWISVTVGLFGCIIVFMAFLFASGKIIKPIVESYEKQKRFISDAGHEIKTPLTVINANVDLMELDGEKEELTDIRQQTKRLTELTNNLVYLSRMEESENSIPKIDIPLSDIVAEEANFFRAPASSHHIQYAVRICPGISVKAAPDSIRRLVSVLLENAMKYAPEGGAVALELTAQKKTVRLSVFNTTKDPVRTEELARVFDRFYRTDVSRNSRTGGHGIGLSIAKAIAENHNGHITAATKGGYDFTVSVTLPVM